MAGFCNYMESIFESFVSTGNLFLRTTYYLTLSTMRKSAMALSASCPGSSFKTEIATPAAISEGLNSKKSIPAKAIEFSTTLQTHYSTVHTRKM